METLKILSSVLLRVGLGGMGGGRGRIGGKKEMSPCGESFRAMASAGREGEDKK